jgi:hypothetical protein
MTLKQEIWIIRSDGTKSALMPAGYYWRYADAEDVADLAAGRMPKRVHVSAYNGPFINEDAARADSEQEFRTVVGNVIARMKL